MRTRISFLFGAFFALAATAQAQLATYNFTGQVGNVTTSASPSLASGVTGTVISRGGGITNGANTSNSFSATGYTASSTLASAITAGDYMSFTVTASSGNTISFGNLSLGAGSTISGPNTLAIEVSINGGALVHVGTDQNIPDLPSSLTTATNGVVFDLTGLNAQISNLSAVSVEIRMYGYAGGSETGSFSLLQLNGNATNAVTLSGNLVPVPEPGTIFGIGAAVLGIGAFVRRKLAKTASQPEPTLAV